jgi:hypothetical protein
MSLFQACVASCSSYYLPPLFCNARDRVAVTVRNIGGLPWKHQQPTLKRSNSPSL